MIWFYKNSIVATVISILGCASAAGGLMLLVLANDWLGIVFILLGAVGVLAARVIHVNKNYDKWWSENVDSQRQEEIKQSREAAIAVYNENPRRRAIKKISELNPEAGAHIQERINQLMAQRAGR